MNFFDALAFLKERRSMNRTKANLMKSGFVVSVVGVVMLHQAQVVSSQINHLALAVLLGLAGYLLVFKKFYFLSSQIAGHSDQYNQAEVKWGKIAGVIAFFIALINLILVFV
ncbi:hypothetical protein BH748_02810 [Enterococcus casseliflavus]|nr:hypothetical protein BH748_02810 [Enterococcus casseliflavus]